MWKGTVTEFSNVYKISKNGVYFLKGGPDVRSKRLIEKERRKKERRGRDEEGERKRRRGGKKKDLFL